MQRWKDVLEMPRIAALGSRFERPIAFIRARISPQSYLGLQLTIGTIVLVSMSWVFGWIADNVVSSAYLTILDIHITDWFHSHVNRVLTQVMLVITNLNGITAMCLYTLVLGAYLAWRKKWYWVGALVLAVPGGMLLNVLLKVAYHRSRPSFTDPLVNLTSYSFPSGHTFSATLFYGMLAAFLVSRIRSWRLRVAVVLAAFLMISLVGLTRIYLGAHYFSDVLAAAAGAAAWLTLCLVTVNTLRLRKEGAKLIKSATQP
jgi:undecaprenyl-diphosphatase